MLEGKTERDQSLKKPIIGGEAAATQNQGCWKRSQEGREGNFGGFVGTPEWALIPRQADSSKGGEE